MIGLKTSALGLGLTLALISAAARAGNGPTLVRGGGSESGGMIAVDQRGADYSLPGGATLHAAPGSALRVFPRAQDLELIPHRKIPTYSVILKSGRIDVSVPEKTAEPIAVLVSTSKDAGGIVMKGNFTATASKNHAAHANRDGDVLVKVGAGWKPLAAGFVQTTVGGIESSVTPLLDAPRVSGSFMRLSFDDGWTELDDVKWAPVKGAHAYQVALAGSTTSTTETTTSTRLPLSMRALPPGAYTLRVRAVDADGMEGRAWTTTQLNILRVVVPPGSLVGNGNAVYLAPHAEVELANTTGLETRLNKSDVFAPASSHIGLYRDEPTTVVVRRTSDKQSVQFRLEPRGVAADIVLGPAAAVWPRDSIDIDIRLSGPDGAALDSIEPQPKVTLGVDELDLKWERSGDHMRARVHPRRGTGPWVLRVEVTDQDGILLGRNFVEIAMDPRVSSSQ